MASPRLTARLRRWVGAAAVALMVPLSVAPASSEAAALASWQTITRERGVLVSTRDEAGRQFPSFRGIGRVDGSVWEIIAVLEDADHAKDWMHDCNGSALLEKIDSHHQIIYNRTDAPWPVADRDIVLESTYQVTNGGKEIWAKFKQTTHTKMPVVNGIVRMPTLEGHYHVVAIDDSHSLVEYRVNADPGGALPDWLVTQTTKDLPLETLVNLRARVKTMRGQYDVAGLKSTNGF